VRTRYQHGNDEYQNRSADDRCSKVAYLRIKINSDQPAVPDERCGAVLESYLREEIPRRSLTSMHTFPALATTSAPVGEFSPIEVKALAARDWLKQIQNNKGRRWRTRSKGESWKDLSRSLNPPWTSPTS